MLINPYTTGIQFNNFSNLSAEINSYYDILYDTVDAFDITARYQLEHGLKIGFRDIFYYISLLYDNNPTSVIDVGCGECTWKKWFPNIIGFDPSPSKYSAADFIDYFDESFSQGHTKNYDCGMALNSVHFVEWDYIEKQIDLAMNIVKDQFLFTFNFDMINSVPSLPMNELILLFDNKINSLNYKIKLLDYPTLRGVSDTNMTRIRHINGTVRFILQHIQ